VALRIDNLPVFSRKRRPSCSNVQTIAALRTGDRAVIENRFAEPRTEGKIKGSVPLATKRDKVILDYSAPNVAKEMHVGHLRSTIIGDALGRILEVLGHEVVRQNHVGDWGTPFGMLIEHLVDLGQGDKGGADSDVGELSAFYRNARVKFDNDPAFAERARRARVVLLQAGDAHTLKLWQALIDISKRHFNANYAKLGVLLRDEHLRGESFYNRCCRKSRTSSRRAA
jgi:arginyl-tRNA synthetase